MQLTSGLISYKGRLSTEHYQLINELNEKRQTYKSAIPLGTR